MDTIRCRAYDNYLNSFIKMEDRRYLPNDRAIQQLVRLRSTVGTIVMTPSQFKDAHFSPLGSFFYFSEQNIANDPLTIALAEREKPNAFKTLSVRYILYLILSYHCIIREIYHRIEVKNSKRSWNCRD